MQLHGFHHLTAITGDVAGNRKFFTETLGMRLVKKTVNQDDVSAYHLFYADGRGSPGTDVTFFDWPMPRASSAGRTALRARACACRVAASTIGCGGLASSA
jgi:glyoxalase family protein